MFGRDYASKRHANCVMYCFAPFVFILACSYDWICMHWLGHCFLFGILYACVFCMHWLCILGILHACRRQAKCVLMVAFVLHVLAMPLCVHKACTMRPCVCLHFACSILHDFLHTHAKGMQHACCSVLCLVCILACSSVSMFVQKACNMLGVLFCEFCVCFGMQFSLSCFACIGYAFSVYFMNAQGMQFAAFCMYVVLHSFVY